MAKERIEVPDGKVYGPYSPGIAAGGMVWLAGQIAPEAGEGITEQTTAALAKIDELLVVAGCTRNDVVFVQVILDDLDDFAAMNDTYGEYFSGIDSPPARAAFETARLPRGAKVEIVAQAMRSD